MKKNFIVLALLLSFGAGFALKSVFSPREAPPVIKKVTGIGGIFFKSKDPEKLKAWYHEHLGLKTDRFGAGFAWREGDDPSKYGFTQWSPFVETTNYFEPSDKNFMINYRVADLSALAAQLASADVTILDSIAVYDYGKFLHIMDIEGNKIELWEPMDALYDSVVRQQP